MFHATTVLPVRHNGHSVMGSGMDGAMTFLLSGSGDLIDPDDGIIAIGERRPADIAGNEDLSRNIL